MHPYFCSLLINRYVNSTGMSCVSQKWRTVGPMPAFFPLPCSLALSFFLFPSHRLFFIPRYFMQWKKDDRLPFPSSLLFSLSPELSAL